jgi:hypothetical protein
MFHTIESTKKALVPAQAARLSGEARLWPLFLDCCGPASSRSASVKRCSRISAFGWPTRILVATSCREAQTNTAIAFLNDNKKKSARTMKREPPERERKRLGGEKSGVFGSAFFWPAYLKSWLWGKAGCWEKLVVRI